MGNLPKLKAVRCHVTWVMIEDSLLMKSFSCRYIAVVSKKKDKKATQYHFSNFNDMLLSMINRIPGRADDTSCKIHYLSIPPLSPFHCHANPKSSLFQLHPKVLFGEGQSPQLRLTLTPGPQPRGFHPNAQAYSRLRPQKQSDRPLQTPATSGRLRRSRAMRG